MGRLCWVELPRLTCIRMIQVLTVKPMALDHRVQAVEACPWDRPLCAMRMRKGDGWKEEQPSGMEDDRGSELVSIVRVWVTLSICQKRASGIPWS